MLFFFFADTVQNGLVSRLLMPIQRDDAVFPGFQFRVFLRPETMPSCLGFKGNEHTTFC
jgi:hypothetical protein